MRCTTMRYMPMREAHRERQSALLGAGKPSFPGKLGWERYLGPGDLGRKLFQAGRAQTKVRSSTAQASWE